MTIHFSQIPATFRHIPRTGSTSFKHWVNHNMQHKEILTVDNYSDMLEHKDLEEIKSIWPNYGTTFAFVRNPYERLVSIFHFVGQDAQRRISKRKNNSNFVNDAGVSIEEDIKLFLEYKKGFTHWILNPSTRKSNSVIMKLYEGRKTNTLMYYLNHVVPDIVVKLEEIETNFIKIQDLLNCHIPFVHTNKSIHTDYRDYYTAETQKIAQQWLAEDLDTFKYTF